MNLKTRIILLAAALIGVIFTIYKLNQPQSTNKLSWCKSRVKSLENKSENFLVQQKSKDWEVLEPQKKVLDPQFMEKWLGQNCAVSVDQRVKDYVLPGGETELVVTFITGEQTRFVRTEPETFVHQGEVFKSRQLEHALRDLYQAAR